MTMPTEKHFACFWTPCICFALSLSACAGAPSQAPESPRDEPLRRPRYEQPREFLAVLGVSWNGMEIQPTIVFTTDVDRAAAAVVLSNYVTDPDGHHGSDDPWELQAEVRMKDLWAYALGRLEGRDFPLRRGELHEQRDRRISELLKSSRRSPVCPR